MYDVTRDRSVLILESTITHEDLTLICHHTQSLMLTCCERLQTDIFWFLTTLVHTAAMFGGTTIIITMSVNFYLPILFRFLHNILNNFTRWYPKFLRKNILHFGVFIINMRFLIVALK